MAQYLFSGAVLGRYLSQSIKRFYVIDSPIISSKENNTMMVILNQL